MVQQRVYSSVVQQRAVLPINGWFLPRSFLGFQLELTISYGFYFQLIPVVAREILGEPSAGRKF